MTRCILAQTFVFYGVNPPPVRFPQKRNRKQGGEAAGARLKEAPGLQSGEGLK